MSIEEIVKKIHQAKFWRTKKIIWPLIISLLINLINWPYIYFQMRHSSQPVPLSYNIISGVGAIGHWAKLFFIPTYALIILIINSFLIYRAHGQDKSLLVRLLIASTIILQIIFLLALILIIRL